jgi:hypothetical protein
VRARRMAVRAFACNVERLLAFVPILEWLPRYKWRECFVTDLIAGLTVGVMHIPQGMAYASLAALPAVYGLYTSLWPCILYPIFGVCAHSLIAPLAGCRHIAARQHWHVCRCVTHDCTECQSVRSTIGNNGRFWIGHERHIEQHIKRHIERHERIKRVPACPSNNHSDIPRWHCSSYARGVDVTWGITHRSSWAFSISVLSPLTCPIN